MNGLSSSLLLLVALGVIVWLLLPERKVDRCPYGLDAMHSDSCDSPSTPTAAPVISASELERRPLTTSSRAASAVPTPSTTYDQRTAYATADEVTARSIGSVQGTARTYSTPNNRSSSGSFLATDPLDTTRRPERFFSSKKNPGLT